MVTMLAVITTCLDIYTKGLYDILMDATLLVVSVSMFITNPMRGSERKRVKQPK